MTRKEYIIEASWVHCSKGNNSCLVFQRGAEWADNHPQWNSIYESTPELGKYVLLLDVANNMHVGKFTGLDGKGFCVWKDRSNNQLRSIVQWMPLPKLPWQRV